MLSLFSSRLFIQKFNIAESFLREGKGENKRSLREGAICKPNRDEQRGRGDKLWNFWAKVLFEYPLLQSLSLYDRCFDIFTTFYKQCDDNFSKCQCKLRFCSMSQFPQKFLNTYCEWALCYIPNKFQIQRKNEMNGISMFFSFFEISEHRKLTKEYY